jgi:hypothetical protein
LRQLEIPGQYLGAGEVFRQPRLSSSQKAKTSNH